MSFSWPDSKGDLQHGANPRNKENSVDEATLGQAVMLETQALWENERDGEDGPKCCQVMLNRREQLNLLHHLKQIIIHYRKFHYVSASFEQYTTDSNKKAALFLHFICGSNMKLSGQISVTETLSTTSKITRSPQRRWRQTWMDKTMQRYHGGASVTQ